MSKPISRRAFLKSSLSAAAVATMAGPAAQTAAAAGTGSHLATLIDISTCIGCGACVGACRNANAAKFPTPEKPFPKMYPERVQVSDWSGRQDVDDRLTPYNWLFIQEVAVEHQGETFDLTIPRRCMHCVNPPCVKLCPWGASRQYANGISRIDTDMCLGGSKCRSVCPWEIPQRQTGDGLYLKLLPSLAGNGIMNKCDRCYDAVARGGVPACITACPEEVQTIGPRNEIIARAQDLAHATGGYLYGIDENGGTNTIYLSPVPFEAINQAIETRPGRPHLGPAADRMADANNIGWALLVAPLAGAAAAAGR
ncbi:MAG: 4Fe-4S dicluster domain-containing protein, partial [Desulfobacterales bacterium]|nr:4Fe-4S dicluster domain-containing protein [Desulfobacterales bacterium]